MPDLISLPRTPIRGHPETPGIPFTGFRLYGRNDKSLRDNQELASPKSEEFQPFPKAALMCIPFIRGL